MLKKSIGCLLISSGIFQGKSSLHEIWNADTVFLLSGAELVCVNDAFSSSLSVIWIFLSLFKFQIQTFSVNQLKNLRHLGTQLLVDFFEHFENYPYSANEIECVFEAAVWPHLERLANESLASPTMLLKLLAAWSKNSRCGNIFMSKTDGSP